ncbi:hypothetical protein [Stenotrophobium rhamnosiphilum]|uniref:Uncharacterized protein n=1 Tax=Stenotrophobium rhamnosiphilum TaxID=2029166 RepID=A0A2T5MFZ6_9GAMM|nr:hypothetical protein [Stenotrophobium rhamnosiphilum]PTU31508.1 hypothetical protein CJD38_09250 [Stenotrophobium rhamnosiphilum]
MSQLSTRAEIIKLARLLKLKEAQLASLEKYEVAQLRDLRERMSAALYDSSRPHLVRVAAATKLIPIALIAAIGEKFYGPLLCARVTGLMSPERAAEVAAKLPATFLADLSIELDPRSAKEVIALLPASLVVTVAKEMLKRREHITMARFVDVLSDKVIRAVMDIIKDDRALLEIAFFVESPDRLEALIGMIPEERLRSIIVTAANDENNLWPEALSMMTQVGDKLRGKMGDITASLSDEQLSAVIAAVERGGMWSAWVGVLSAMSVESQRRVLILADVESPEALSALATAAKEHGLWNQLLPLLKFMNDAPRKQLEDLFESIKSTLKNMG